MSNTNGYRAEYLDALRDHPNVALWGITVLAESLNGGFQVIADGLGGGWFRVRGISGEGLSHTIASRETFAQALDVLHLVAGKN